MASVNAGQGFSGPDPAVPFATIPLCTQVVHVAGFVAWHWHLHVKPLFVCRPPWPLWQQALALCQLEAAAISSATPASASTCSSKPADDKPKQMVSGPTFSHHCAAVGHRIAEAAAACTASGLAAATEQVLHVDCVNYVVPRSSTDACTMAGVVEHAGVVFLTDTYLRLLPAHADVNSAMLQAKDPVLYCYHLSMMKRICLSHCLSTVTVHFSVPEDPESCPVICRPSSICFVTRNPDMTLSLVGAFYRYNVLMLSSCCACSKTLLLIMIYLYP